MGLLTNVSGTGLTLADVGGMSPGSLPQGFGDSACHGIRAGVQSHHSHSSLACNMSEGSRERSPAPGDSRSGPGNSAREARRAARAQWPVRKFRLADEPGPDLSETTTATERLAMMWSLARDAWTLAGRTIPDYPRDRMPVRVVRPADDRSSD